MANVWQYFLVARQGISFTALSLFLCFDRPVISPHTLILMCVCTITHIHTHSRSCASSKANDDVNFKCTN